ncbi:MAG: protease modulator HflC [Verrucomicrobiota bacterium]
MSPALKSSLVPLALVGAFLLWNSFYIVPMTEQVIITQFGKVRGTTVTEPGLHLKTPFIDTVNRFDKRILEWDGRPIPMTTRDKQYLEVDTFARWRITDPLQFFRRMRDERSAQSRLDDIIGSNTMSTVANHDLIELIRTDKDRKSNPSAQVAEAEIAPLLAIKDGRVAIESAILKQAQPVVKEFGIEILDIRFKRLNYSKGVLEKIYERMISEREQIAARFRSEGEGEAARISGTRALELNRITSEAYRKIQEISGTAEAKASAIYAEAFNASPQASEFYAFQKTLETYGTTASTDTTVVFSTGSDLFRLMKTVTPLPPAPAAPAKAAAPTPPPAVVPAPAPTPAVEPVPAGQ